MAEPTDEELLALLQQHRRQQQALARGEDVDAYEAEEPPSPPLKTCREIRQNGRFCGSVAVKERDFCPFHLLERKRQLRMARARARRERWRFQVPPLEDLHAVQVSISQVLQALANDQLETQRGRAILYGLQQAATNLCRPKKMWKARPFRCSELMELVGPESDLPEGVDVNTPPEVAFPETEPAEVSERAQTAAAGAEAREQAAAAKPAGAPPLSGGEEEEAAGRKQPQSVTTEAAEVAPEEDKLG